MYRSSFVHLENCGAGEGHGGRAAIIVIHGKQGASLAVVAAPQHDICKPLCFRQALRHWPNAGSRSRMLPYGSCGVRSSEHHGITDTASRNPA